MRKENCPRSPAIGVFPASRLLWDEKAFERTRAPAAKTTTENYLAEPSQSPEP